MKYRKAWLYLLSRDPHGPIQATQVEILGPWVKFTVDGVQKLVPMTNIMVISQLEEWTVGTQQTEETLRPV